MGYSNVRQKIIIDIKDQRSEPEHFDAKIKLFYILLGSMEMIVDGRKCDLGRGDILVVNANTKYQFLADEGILYCEMSIPYAVIEDSVGDMGLTFVCDSTKEQGKIYEKLRAVLNKLLDYNLHRTEIFTRMGEIGLYFYVMEILVTNFSIKEIGRAHV